MSNQDSEYSRQSHSSSTKNREDEEKVVGVQEQPHSTATHTDRADHPCGATAPSYCAETSSVRTWRASGA